MQAFIRPVDRGDAAAVQAFVQGLSMRSRVERFFAPMKELNPRQLDRIVAGPGLNLAAVDEAGRIVGHAQYVVEKRADQAGEAEFGVVVADDWQGRGLGEKLMRRLLDHAWCANVGILSGVALADNGRMRLLARKLGFVFKRDDDPQLVRMERLLEAA